MTPLTRRLLALIWPILALAFFAVGLLTISTGLRNSWAPLPMVNPAAVPSEPPNSA